MGREDVVSAAFERVRPMCPACARELVHPSVEVRRLGRVYAVTCPSPGCGWKGHAQFERRQPVRGGVEVRVS